MATIVFIIYYKLTVSIFVPLWLVYIRNPENRDRNIEKRISTESGD